jgi:hypothetical protein
MAGPTSGQPLLNPVEMRRLEASAHILAKEGKIVEALNVSKDLVSRWQALAARDEAVLPQLAKALGSYSVLARHAGDADEALDAGVKSLTHWRILADKDLARHGPDLSNALMGLAPHMARSHFQNFYRMREEAAKLRLRLLELGETKYLLPAAEACLLVAEMAGNFGHPHEAKAYAEKSVVLWRQLASDDLIQHGPKLIRSLRRLSIEQLDTEGFGKVPLQEVRKVRLTRLIALLKAKLGPTKERRRQRQDVIA